MPCPKKTKFGGRAIKDAESICNSNKETDSRIILIGTIPISLNCFTISLTLLTFIKSKEMEKSLVKVKEKQPMVDEGCIYKGITIEPSKGSRPHNVILEEFTVEMKKTHSVKCTKGATLDVMPHPPPKWMRGRHMGLGLLNLVFRHWWTHFKSSYHNHSKTIKLPSWWCLKCPLHILESHLLVLTQVPLLLKYFIYITKTKSKTYIRKTLNTVLALTNAECL